MIILWLLACSASLRRVLPAGPVLSPVEAATFDAVLLPEVDYTGPPRLGAPLPPLQLFGVYYSVDVVIVSDHPDWDMHEYARLDTPQGPVWMAKDSDNDYVQTISAELDDLDSWAAEVPVPRQQSPVTVSEEWNGRRLSFEIAYTNPAGEPVEVSVEGVVPRRPPSLRNGNTMGHSQQAVAAVLDLERFGHRAKAEISIDGQPYGVERMLGVYGMRFLLQQAQAGFAIADYSATPTDDGLAIVRPGGDVDWPTHADEAWQQETLGALTLLRHDDGYLSRTYAFADGGLAWVEINQHGRSTPVLRAQLSPALPDLTRPFAGEAESRFRFDVNGQIGHGTGTIRARWVTDDDLVVEIAPSAPAWLMTRPMVGTIHYTDDTARVRIRRAE
ncbi:MAG: hypothetical protein ACI8S6_004231 [Myxococcota bacterium]